MTRLTTSMTSSPRTPPRRCQDHARQGAVEAKAHGGDRGRTGLGHGGNFVPGEKLGHPDRPDLDVSGGGEIEAVVWAVSGDNEQFFFRRFGDKKTKFRGELTTGLGKPPRMTAFCR